MLSALDQRIEERTRQLADLTAAISDARSKIEVLERDAEVINVELRVFQEARQLVMFENDRVAEKKVEKDLIQPIADPVPQGDHSFRMVDSTRSMFSYAVDCYPRAVSNQQFAAEIVRQGFKINRDNLRSALWTHASRGLLEKVGTGLYKITATGAARIGRELPTG